VKVVSDYKLIALDMDGTLLNDNKQISKENIQSIQAAREAGIVVSLTTGRGMQSARPFIEQLDLDSPLIMANGSEIWRNPDELYSRQLMHPHWIEELHRIAVSLQVWFWGYAVDGMYNTDKWTDEVAAHEWLKFGYYTTDKRKLMEINQQVVAKNLFEVTNSHPDNLEINPKGINKARALLEICRQMNIDISQVAAMGDSLNDLEMIKICGLGVAMSNAQDEVKRWADYITDSNNENGVAKAIKEKILFKG